MDPPAALFTRKIRIKHVKKMSAAAFVTKLGHDRLSCSSVCGDERWNGNHSDNGSEESHAGEGRQGRRVWTECPRGTSNLDTLGEETGRGRDLEGHTTHNNLKSFLKSSQWIPKNIRHPIVRQQSTPRWTVGPYRGDSLSATDKSGHACAMRFFSTFKHGPLVARGHKLEDATASKKWLTETTSNQKSQKNKYINRLLVQNLTTGPGRYTGMPRHERVQKGTRGKKKQRPSI